MMAVEVGEPIHQVSQLVLQEPIEVLRETHVGADSDLRRVPFFLFSLFLFCFLFFRLIVTFFVSFFVLEPKWLQSPSLRHSDEVPLLDN